MSEQGYFQQLNEAECQKRHDPKNNYRRGTHDRYLIFRESDHAVVMKCSSVPRATDKTAMFNRTAEDGETFAWEDSRHV